MAKAKSDAADLSAGSAPAPVQPAEAAPAPEPPAATSSAPAPAKTARVKCISKDRPWTDTRPLDFKEEAEVSAELAALMEAKEQVVIIG